MTVEAENQENKHLLDHGLKGSRHHVIWRFLAGCVMALALCWGGICVLLYIELKALFHLSQTQVEILAGIHTLGIYFVLPYSLIHRRFGFYPTFITGFIITSAGYLLQALAAYFPHTLLGAPCLLYIYMFMFTNGRCGIQFLLIITAMTSTPKAHSGKAVSCTVATMYFGFTILAPVYKRYFANVRETALYFLVAFGFLAGNSVVYLIVYVLTGGTQTSNSGHETDQKSLAQSTVEQHLPNKSEAEASNEKIRPRNKDSLESTGEEIVPYSQMFWSYKFHLYLWSGGVTLATNILYFTNSCLLLQSLGLEVYQTSLIMTMMISVIASHLASGSLYDYLQTVSSKVYLMIGAALFNILSLAIVLGFMDKIYMIFISAILMSSTMGGGLSIYLNFSANIFGLKNIGIVQGILMTCYEIFCLTTSLIIGLLYDHFGSQQVRRMNKKEQHTCYGKDCFWWSYLVMFCAALVAAVLPVLLLHHVKKNESKGMS